MKILKDTNEYQNIWQAFCVLIPIKTVGVMGDSRTYDNLIALRAVTSTDGMTAKWYEFKPEILDMCSNEIINKVNFVNRVVYYITSKPPGTIDTSFLDNNAKGLKSTCLGSSPILEKIGLVDNDKVG